MQSIHAVYTCSLYVHLITRSVHSIDGLKGVSCIHGDVQGELRICVLPSHMCYDAHWPTRKVPVHCTPHFVSYHMKGKVHAVVLSEQLPATHLPTGDGPDDVQKIDKGKISCMATMGRRVECFVEL